MTDPNKESDPAGDKEVAQKEQKEGQPKMVLDPVTGEMVSKSELKSRTKQRAKAEKKAEKLAEKQKKGEKTEETKQKEEELDPTVL